MANRPMLAVSMKGLKELKEKCSDSPRPIYANPWRRALLDLMKESKRLAQQRAPKDAGRLAARNRYRIPKTPVPLWGVLSNSAVRKGYRYGFALDAGHAKKRGGKSYDFHRRAGGGSTKNWFRGILDVVRGFANSRIGRAETDVEREWNK